MPQDPQNDAMTQLPERDRLMTRPSPDPLPTQLDPMSDEARGGTADPKPVPRRGQGDPKETEPPPDDIGRTA